MPKLREIIRRVIKEETQRFNIDNLVDKNPIDPRFENPRYKLVRAAYDDEGTNMTILFDKKKKEIISYSITGKSQVDQFKKLSTRKF